MIRASAPRRPPEIPIAFLATKWNCEPESRVRKEELIERARIALGKYDLEAQELDQAAPLLARALHMRIEQNGGGNLNDALEQDIERQVLEWCRCCPKHSL